MNKYLVAFLFSLLSLPALAQAPNAKFNSIEMQGGITCATGKTCEIGSTSVTAQGGTRSSILASWFSRLLAPSDFAPLYGDGQQATFAVTVAQGSTALTAAGASFGAGDVGKLLRIATVSGTLSANIATVVSPTQITLDAGAQIALSGASVAVFWGHDDYPAFQAALNSGKPVSVPVVGSATYWLSQPLSYPSKAILLGPDRNALTLKLMPGVNADVMVGAGSYALFGTNSGLSVDSWRIQGMTLDGNRDNQYCSNPDTCNGLSVYGSGFKLSDIYIRNVVGNCLRTDYQQNGGGGGTVEGVAGVVCGRHGWRNDGPHDISATQVGFIDAGQEADNTYYGMVTGRFSTGKYLRMHNWHQASATNRVAQQLYDGTGGSIFENSHFEGGRGQYHLAGNSTSMIGVHAYAPFGPDGSALVTITGSGNRIVGGAIEAADGQKYYALKIGGASAAFGNVVTGGTLKGFSTLGPFNFANDGGYNTIDIQGSSAAGGVSNLTGTLHAYSRLRYSQSGTGVEFNTSGFNNNVRIGSPTNVIGSGGAANSVSIGGTGNSTGSASQAVTIGGQSLNALAFASVALGGVTVNNNATYGGSVAGQTINFSGAYSGQVGTFASADRGRYGFQNISASGRFAVTGDAQSGQSVLRGSTNLSTATTVTVQVTTNGDLPGATNIINIPTIGLHYHLAISGVCQNTSATGHVWASWDPAYGDLDRKSDLTYSGAFSSAAAPSRSAGAFSSATLTVAANSMNNGLSAIFTLPAGTTADTVRCVATSTSLQEVQ